MAIKKKKETIGAIAVLAIVMIVSFIIYLLPKSEYQTGKSTEEKKMQNENPFPFNKQGELSFIGKGDKIISSIDIEIAKTDESRQQGLMFRTSMEEKQGMLFIFEYEDMQSFWMKNTILPLDILFVNAKKEIVKIHRNTMPFQESPGYESGSPAQYVVEVNAGYCDKYKITEGNKITFSHINK